MKTKLKQQTVPVIFTLLAIGLPYFSNWCIDSFPSCYGSLIHQAYQYFTSPLYNFSLFFLPAALLLIFVPQGIFNSWLKLAVWALPLAFIFTWSTHVNSNAFMDFFPFYRDDAARLAGQVFSIISLTLIIIKAFAPRVRLSNERRYGLVMTPIAASGQLVLLFSIIFSFAIAVIGYIEVARPSEYSLNYEFNLLLVAVITCAISIYYIFATISRVRQRAGIIQSPRFTWHFTGGMLLLALFISIAVFGFVK